MNRDLLTLEVEGEWSEHVRDVFVERRCRAVDWQWSSKRRDPVDLSRVLSLPGLVTASISVGRVQALPATESLRGLSLFGSVLDDGRLDHLGPLEYLELDAPQGAEVLRVPDTVVELYVARVASPALSLEGVQHVRHLRVAGTRKASLDRLQLPVDQELALQTLELEDLSVQPGFACPVAPGLTELALLGRGNHFTDVEGLLCYQTLTKCVLHLEHELDVEVLRRGLPHLERLVVLVEGRIVTRMLPDGSRP